MTMFTYYDLLAKVHEQLRPDLYLEIGVHEGHSLAFVQPGTRAVGVDPEPKVASPPPGCEIVASTSDDFFARADVGSVLGGPIDLAFIDGLHHFDQTLRDFANVERHASPDGVVLVHDCLPIDEVTSARERTTMVWSGDVWKTVVALRRHRPDLAVNTIDIAPTGMAVITGLDPTNNVLPENFDEIVIEMFEMTYADLIAANPTDLLSVIPPPAGLPGFVNVSSRWRFPL